MALATCLESSDVSWSFSRVSVTVRQANVVRAHCGKVVPAARRCKAQRSSTCHVLACARLLHHVPLPTANHWSSQDLRGGRDRLHFTTEGRAFCHLCLNTPRAALPQGPLAARFDAPPPLLTRFQEWRHTANPQEEQTKSYSDILML